MEVRTMKAERGTLFIEGIDVIIKRDLDKHKSLLDKNNLDIQAFEGALAGEIGRKKFYNRQKGKKNYNDDAMDQAIQQMVVNIAHLSGRVKVTKELRRQNTQIVDHLTKQLEEYYVDLRNSK